MCFASSASLHTNVGTRISVDEVGKSPQIVTWKRHVHFLLFWSFERFEHLGSFCLANLELNSDFWVPKLSYEFLCCFDWDEFECCLVVVHFDLFDGSPFLECQTKEFLIEQERIRPRNLYFVDFLIESAWLHFLPDLLSCFLPLFLFLHLLFLKFLLLFLTFLSPMLNIPRLLLFSIQFFSKFPPFSWHSLQFLLCYCLRIKIPIVLHFTLWILQESIGFVQPTELLFCWLWWIFIRVRL